MKNDLKQREKELLFKAPNCVLCWLVVAWKLTGCIMKGLLSMMRATNHAFKTSMSSYLGQEVSHTDIGRFERLKL